jgi:hypothetical protein
VTPVENEVFEALRDCCKDVRDEAHKTCLRSATLRDGSRVLIAKVELELKRASRQPLIAGARYRIR